jgi:hypothetical protein
VLLRNKKGRKQDASQDHYYPDHYQQFNHREKPFHGTPPLDILRLLNSAYLNSFAGFIKFSALKKGGLSVSYASLLLKKANSVSLTFINNINRRIGKW